MYILKFIVNLIVAFTVLLTAIGLVLPAKIHVERSIVIQAPPASVFAQVNNFRAFNLWSPWAKLDPNTQYDYTGPESGVGAKMSWRSDNAEVGFGSQEIIASELDRSLKVILKFGDMESAQASYDLLAEGSGTKITWGFDQDAGYNLILRYFGLMFDSMIGKDYETGLASLKLLAETASPPPQ